jgi:putative Mn2+ efflux pump MntP
VVDVGIVATLLLAVGLALDASAVTIGARASGQTSGFRAGWRLAFHFGLFQGLMPVAGWLLGYSFASFVTAYDHWIAFSLLTLIGVNMVRSGLRPQDESPPLDPSKGWTLVLLSLATSIDAFAVGLSLAMLEVAVWGPAVIIGLVTMGLSTAAYWLGARLGAAFGHRLGILGGLVLIGLGLETLMRHFQG